MPRPKTPRRAVKKGGKTKRVRGRARRRVGGATAEEEQKYRATWATINKAMQETPLKPVLTVNPKSKFVVVTYWWGRGNINRNLQSPCPEDIADDAKEILEEELIEDDPEYKTEIHDPFLEMWKLRKEKAAMGGLSPEEDTRWKQVRDKRAKVLATYFARDDIKVRMVAVTAKQIDVYRSRGKFREPTRYEEMIAKWEDTCREMNCNYLSAEYSAFAVPGGYQAGINAKPSFIKKAIEVCEGRGVLYIDGDMFVKTYPKIFDMPNIDFGARSWNADPRSSQRFREDVCFDPYIFETSGGTMFFANTDWSKKLLMAWEGESRNIRSMGKADDRILSQVFTINRFAEVLNVLHLPIEYLWLTDLYSQYDFGGAADESRAIITHPYCLTGEERAQEMSASSANRQPIGYSKYVEDKVECTTRGGVFYEYIYFPTRDMVDSYGPYLEYMRTATNPETGEKLFEVVSFDDLYGSKYSVTARTNMANARAIQTGSDPVLRLPLNPQIPQILAGLLAGKDVYIGSEAQQVPGIEFSGRNIGTEQQSTYLIKTVLDTKSSMFLSGKNSVITHLIAMCKTLDDINVHLQESFLFFTRIRWAFRRESQGSRKPFSMERM